MKSGGGLTRTKSQLMMMLQNEAKEEQSPATVITSGAATLSEASSTEPPKKGMVRVRSGSNLAALVVEQKQGQDLKLKEDKFKSDIGPQMGFDLSKIGSHYESRRRLRRDKMVLRYGEFIPLIARND